MNTEIMNELKKNHYITTKRVIELGYSKTLLVKYVKENKLERIRQGVYILKDDLHDDMYTLMMRSKNIIFSHETSLFLNGLSERTPYIQSLTIPSDSCLPQSIADECKCFYVKKKFHSLGRTEIKNTFGNWVRCYDIERTICDIVKDRKRIDDELVISALKNYSRLNEKNLDKLSEYSSILGIEEKIREYMEILL
jgi:predicted transcriptional regulator of viral defense system